MLVFAMFQVQAQSELDSGKIVFNNSSIQLDGELNEPIWKNLIPEGGFLNYIPNNGDLASNKTEVKMFHNGKNLFISAVYHDTTSDVQIGSLKRDDIGTTGADSDSFAIIIDTYNQQQSGYFFIVNMGGALIDALIARRGDGFGVSTSWNAVWNAKTSIKGNLKIFEVEIPLKALGYKADTPEWGVMFHTRNIKINEWTTSTPIGRNFSQFDLRLTKTFEVENLLDNKSSRFAVTPAVTMNHSDDVANDVTDTMVKPSVDVQYNVSSSLKLDATINPDFSQIDVDRQVTNLSRFSVFFPERRNFFLENSDLFTGLGASGVNPFYSRRIGADSDISLGLKLSGNIAKKTRLGVLNVATKADDDNSAQNFGALVMQQQLSGSLTATGFLINRQETDGFSFLDDYNRVGGVNLNYQSKNNKWTGLANVARSFTNNVSGDNNFYNLGVWYSSAKTAWRASIKKVEKNYITDVGFVPRLYNYDAISQNIIREGYTQASGRFSLTKFCKDSKIIDNHRYLNMSNQIYWDDEGDVTQATVVINNDLVFKDQSFLYGGMRYEHVNLKYAFDPLNNGNAIIADKYRYVDAGLGYSSAQSKKFQYGGNISYGSYYSGHKNQVSANAQYRLMPLARLQIRYERNGIDLKSLGSETFHLARFTGEVFFSNRLNWTTYVQYNTQFDNFNINSRLQWEYKPLSYIYLVVSDNYSQDIIRKNWGVAFKMNYRFDF
jgi:hypothetical protein